MKNIKALLVFFFFGLIANSQLKAQSDNKEADKDQIVEFADQQPEFPGGYPEMEKFIQEHLKYPTAAIDGNIQGTVFLKFIVHSDGRISDVKIIKDIGAGCGMEGKRIIESMPAWNPGRMNGKPVATPVSVPLKFILRGNDNPVDSTMAKVYRHPVGEVYDHVDEKPMFPGGRTAMGDFLKANIQYPIAARQAGVKGKVIITAIMDPDGNLIDPEVLKDIGYGCGAEAVRLCIAMPKWTPGKRDGQAVNCRVRIPVVFSPHQ